MSVSLSLTVYLSFILTLLFPLCVFLVMYYAEPGFPWHTYVTCIIGYYAAFAILLLVPIDIATVVIDRRTSDTDDSPQYNADRETLFPAYNTFFTMILILGSFVLVFEEHLNTDGYFTLIGRVASSLKRMALVMGAGLVAGLIVLGILIGQGIVDGSVEALKLAAIIVTNTVYEAILMFLLGYALIEYPRSVWDMSNLDKYLLKTQMKAASEFKQISDAQLSVSLAVSDVLKTQRVLPGHADQKVKNALEILVSECPSEFKSDRLGKVAADKEGKINVHTLAQLRTRLNKLRSTYKMAQAKIEGTKVLAYNLEDIVEAKNNPDAKVIHWSLTDKDSTEAEYNWHIFYLPWLYRLWFLFLAMLSVFSFLGVVCSMHGVSNDVSVYFLAVHSTSTSVGGICVFILITLSYTVYLTTWAIFQIKLTGMMELVPHRSTPKSISFNVRAVARFAAPLAFFYLGWIAENGIDQGDWQYNDAKKNDEQVFMPSAFANFYNLQSVAAIRSSFGTIFPIILYIVMFLFVINAFNRILIYLKFDEYQFGASMVTEEQLREGKRQLQRNKRITQRSYRRVELKNIIASVTGSSGGGGWFGGGKDNGSPKKGDPMRPSDLEDGERFSVREPGDIAFTVEKKSTKALGMGASWKETYMIVRSPGYLHFYKDQRSYTEALKKNSDPSYSSDPSAVVLDLRLVMDFKVPERSKNKESLALDIVASDDTIRIKLRTIEEVLEYKHKLQQWKDFCIDYGTTYPMGLSVGRVGDDSPGRLSASSGGINPVKSASSGVSGGLFKKTPSSADSSSAAVSNPLLRGSNASAATALGAVNVDDTFDDDDDRKAPGAVTMKSAAASAAGAAKSGAVPGAGAAVSRASDSQPRSLEGWVEKKGHGRVHMGGDWQKRYMRIDEAVGMLTYAKSSSPSEVAAGTIDLKMAKDVVPYDKAGRPDYTRFSVDVDDRVYKFRVASEMEGKRWIEGLNQWKDYFLMNM